MTTWNQRNHTHRHGDTTHAHRNGYTCHDHSEDTKEITTARKTHTARADVPNLTICNTGYLTGAAHLPAGRGALRAADGARPTCVNCAKVYDRGGEVA